MMYGYVRVSTIDQNIDRQIQEVLAFGVSRKKIFVDKKSGCDFERPAYKRLMKVLKEDDLVVIKSIDRLGRNYIAITEEWRKITKVAKADIKVLDMPLLDTRIQAENLVGRFLSDIVLQILSFVAENERTNIRSRQAEGIAIAKKKGVHCGRPYVNLPPNFLENAVNYQLRAISYWDAVEQTKMRPSTFYKYYKKYTSKDTIIKQ